MKIEERLAEQIAQFDNNGLFLDPTPLSNPPIPYDIFPRHYLEVLLLLFILYLFVFLYFIINYITGRLCCMVVIMERMPIP